MLSLSYDDSLCSSRYLDTKSSAQSYQQQLAFKILTSGRTDLVVHAISLLGPGKVNCVNEQGMTPLMCACMAGNAAMVQVFIDTNAKLDIPVPNNPQLYPSVSEDIRDWTALTFSAAQGHLAVAQMLLENNACVHGCPDEQSIAECPLQVAACAGNLEMVDLLLNKGGNPVRCSKPRSGVSVPGMSTLNCFTLTAAHGHKSVLTRLLSEPQYLGSADMLSLEEMLAEGNYHPSDCLNVRSNKAVEQREVALQESLYYAGENAFLDICTDLNSMGVPWSFQTWLASMTAAYLQSNKSIMLHLLDDFRTLELRDCTTEFCEDGLPILFELLKQSRDDQIAQRLSSVFSALYGPEPQPPIKPNPQLAKSTRIDPQFVNNPEMADVTFIVEGKLFYAHKIILVNASNKFKGLLANRVSENGSHVIQIDDVKYSVFKTIMMFLYDNTLDSLNVEQAEVIELMKASQYFDLYLLMRSCQILVSRFLDYDNALYYYKHARVFGATELMQYCEGFFLQNMPYFMDQEKFVKYIFSRKQNPNVINCLEETLVDRLRSKVYV